MTEKQIIAWLLAGDVAIQYQTWRDLLHKDKPALRKKIETMGWGKKFLSCRNANGHWGQGFYQPKWTSTHYTLLDLKYLGISPRNTAIRETLKLVFAMPKGSDGGVYPIGVNQRCDVCVNGMVLNYASYFGVKENDLKSIVDFLLHEKMRDGGFNCRSNGSGATHSSLHTTLSVLEGIAEYERNGYTYRLRELKKAQRDSEEFILVHKLFRSHHTGEVIHPSFLVLYYPGRWYYDILKALDYFQSVGHAYDPRMQDALDLILQKRTDEGLWKLPAKHPGQVHFELEKAGKPSRWNTLRALRVLKHFKVKTDS
jgi:hypothetical protein